jgi:hypothetical protein
MVPHRLCATLEAFIDPFAVSAIGTDGPPDADLVREQVASAPSTPRSRPQFHSAVLDLAAPYMDPPAQRASVAIRKFACLTAGGSPIRTFRLSRDQSLSELVEPCAETIWRARRVFPWRDQWFEFISLEPSVPGIRGAPLSVICTFPATCAKRLRRQPI